MTMLVSQTNIVPEVENFSYVNNFFPMNLHVCIPGHNKTRHYWMRLDQNVATFDQGLYAKVYFLQSSHQHIFVCLWYLPGK